MSTVTIDRIKSRQRVVLSVLPRNENSIGDTREEIVDNLKQAAKELKLVREGKLEGRSAYELLNEL